MDQAILQEAFRQARLKVYRANRHVEEAQAWFNFYTQSDFCKLRVDRDINGAQSVYVEAAPLPAHLVLAIGDAFHCLSSALDYVATGMMRAAKRSTTRVSFPSDETRKALRKSFMIPKAGSKTPPNRRIMETFPCFALMVLQKIQPYRGGDCGVWEVRKADNIDKHNLIVPSVVVTELRGIELFDERYNNRFSLGAQVSPGGRVNLVGYNNGPDSQLKIESEGQPSAEIRFSETMEVFAGDPVLPTMTQSVQLVQGVIDVIERAAFQPRPPA